MQKAITGPQGLVNNPNSKPRENPAAQLLHHFHVEYAEQDVKHVLRPGQVIPIWDLDKWKQIDTVDVHCSNAVRWQDVLIAAEGFTHPVENSVQAAAWVAMNPPDRLDQEQQALQHQLSRVILGNVGGTRIVRPDPLPVGIIPMEARRGYGQYTFESDPISALQWALEVEGIPVAENPLPELRFFVESKVGEFEGYDVRTGRARTLTPIPLPFTWSSGEELEILIGEGNGIEKEMATLMAITQGVRRLIEMYSFKGTVFFGWDLPDSGEGLPDVDTQGMTLAYYMDNRQEEEEVYEIPFIGNNPFDILDARPREQIRELLRGGPRYRPQGRRLPTIAEVASRHRQTV